ncbi:MAG: hypothetical protein ACREIA_14045 [Opitutaceae bacterium]
MSLAGRETFDLEAGMARVRITRIEEGPTINAVVLTKDAGFDESDSRSLEYGPGVKVLREYPVPLAGTAKFGDVDGVRIPEVSFTSPLIRTI